ncbi:MAG TPA: hypothetical protein VEI28_00340 [Thermodesulfovibrionales bacterium]|nr:hypothetical protein [Thermodesulfovibrionales bacterium]
MSEPTAGMPRIAVGFIPSLALFVVVIVVIENQTENLTKRPSPAQPCMFR